LDAEMLGDGQVKILIFSKEKGYRIENIISVFKD
jgi:hypothetical protein